jgi:hypothetical protein
MCATTQHYTIFLIIKREIGNAFTLVGWDEAPMDHIFFRQVCTHKNGNGEEPFCDSFAFFI